MSYLRSGPEHLFDVEVELTADDGTTQASMPLGPWTRFGGAPSAAALGVLVDDVLGYSFTAGRTGGSSVSSELAVDVVAPLPTTGRLHGRATRVATDGRGAVTRAEVLDDAGTVVACAIAHGRFVPDAPSPDAVRPVPDVAADDGLLDRLRDVTVVEGGLEVVATERLLNPRATLHGGISFALVELAAALAVPEPSQTTSVRVHLLRPGTLGDRLVVETTVVHHGRTRALVDVVGRLESGKPVFRATVTRE